MVKTGMVISDRYEIIDKVGSGGMADVYKAKDQRLNRFVAIKVLKPEYSSDKSFVNKFRGEAQSAAGLSHPNIVNVYDVGDDSGLHYIVMELVEGITLKRFIERKGKLEIKEAVGIAIQIAQGMEAAHDNHIIHRDIKPQNIIISRDGKVKVTDFGIAKATTSNTITSNAMGSVHYLSPEQARGGYSDEKSDIYSLGVTIYEMLSGKVPFAGDNTVSVALLHIQGEAMPLRELDPSIPLSIDKIVQKCMQKKAERRYHSASELIADLKKAIANPDGDFVQIPAFMASDSPTINISDDISKIKNGVYLDEELQDYSNEPTSKILEEEDEEDLDTVDSKVEKFFVAGSIVAVLILGIAIMFLVFKFIIPSGKSNPDVPDGGMEITDTPTPTPTVTDTPTPDPADVVYNFVMPRVTGLTEADARIAINNKIANVVRDKEAFIIIKEDYSETYEAGMVMEQYPTVDSEVETTFEIILTISLGAKPIELPDVTNLTQDRADTKLSNDLGLKVMHDYVTSNEIEEGRVITTNPEPLTIVKKGDTITIIISSGPEQAVVPELIGKTEAEAITALENAGLKKGNISYAPSDKYASGIVTYQSTTKDQKVNKGTTIDMMVSTGPEEVTTGGGNNSHSISYIGSVIIDINPFDYVEGDSAFIELEMYQDGWSTTIYEGNLSSNKFPLHVGQIEGESTNNGIVTMYVDGIPFKLPSDVDAKTWTAKFTAVED